MVGKLAMKSSSKSTNRSTCRTRMPSCLASAMNQSSDSSHSEPATGPCSAQLDAALTDAKLGCENALGKLLVDSQRYLLAIANQSLSPELRVKISPSDLVQDTLLEALRDFKGFQGERYSELRAWLRKILLNNAANASRHFVQTQKRQFSREVPLTSDFGGVSPLADPVPTPSKEAVALERELALERALSRLPPQMRMAIVLRNREHLSFAQIGMRLERSTEAARKLWARAIERLQGELS
jgi:RNA polymerase sigma-70 factor (ECF subfamily)